MQGPGRGSIMGAVVALAAMLVAPGAMAQDEGAGGLLENAFDALNAPLETRSSTDKLVDALEENGALTPEQVAEIRDAERFSLQWGGRLQVSAILFDGDDFVEGVPGDPNVRSGFRLNSARLYANGQAYYDWLTYGMSVEFAEEDGPAEIEVQLLDAFLAVDKIIPYHTVIFGVGKTPFSRQNLNSSSKLMFQNRSIVVKELEDTFIDREVGISLAGRFPLADDLVTLKYGAGIFNGSGSEGLQGDLNDGKLYTVRAAVDLFEEMDGSESDIAGGPLAISIGGGYFANDDVAADPSGYTVDGMVKVAGLAVTGGYVVVDYDPDLDERIQLPDFATDFKSKGWYLQGGFMVVPELLELAVRYEEYDGNDKVDDNRDVSAVTGGANVYLAGHGLKAGLEYVARIEDEGAELDNDTLTLRVQLRY